MNIFYLDEDPVSAAQLMVDSHVIKMILESAQLLSTAHRILDGFEYVGVSKSGRKIKRYELHDSREPIVYQATHVNHPSAIWSRSSVENYNWLVDHMFALMSEYKFRFNKKHKCDGELSYMVSTPPVELKEFDATVIPSCMDKQYIISNDPVKNYRNYYKYGKKHDKRGRNMHIWTNRDTPEWIND